jgi:hypothetical protein
MCEAGANLASLLKWCMTLELGQLVHDLRLGTNVHDLRLGTNGA